MSAVSLHDTSKSWHPLSAEPPVRLFLTGADGDAGQLMGIRVAGFPLALTLIGTAEPIDASEIDGAAAAVIQVAADDPTSVGRFADVAARSRTPLVAAAYDPPLALVRSLMRAGAHDVIPLPLDVADLESSLAPLRAEIAGRGEDHHRRSARLVSVIKSVGGAGATALITQLATRFAASEGKFGREACLVDLDVQFGNAAFYLGLKPQLSLIDLIEAGARIDGSLLRSTTTLHPSGLAVIASPPEMIPLESLSSDQMIEIAELAMREFGTLFLDLPSNWTNWSLSLLARSDIVLLVIELSVAGLQRARRQLDLIAAQELGEIDIRIVVNRFEKGMFRALKPGMVREALGRDIAFTIANDFAVMSAAIDRGVTIGEVRRRSTLGKNIAALDSGLAAALGLER